MSDTPLVFKYLVQTATAFGTVGAVVLALFGDTIRAKWFSPKLKISVDNNPPSLVNSKADDPYHVCHLIIENQRPLFTARNVRVVIRQITQRLDKDEWKQIHLAIPVQLRWPGHRYGAANGMLVNMCVKKSEHVDFGRLTKSHFTPIIYYKPCVFDGNVKKGETLRYHIEVVADNYWGPYSVVEVHWDGEFDDDPQKMAQHLRIRAIDSTKKAAQRQ